MTEPPARYPVPPSPPAGQQMQILLPQPLQDIMQQFPSVLTRLTACETKPAPVTPVGWVIATSIMAGLIAGLSIALAGYLIWQMRDLFLPG